MTKNPFINAAVAIAYILLVSVVMYYGTAYLKPGPSFFAPVTVIALFTLSAAIMGYVFCYEPLLFLISGKKKEAADLFLKTVATFGILTSAVLILYFSRIIH